MIRSAFNAGPTYSNFQEPLNLDQLRKLAPSIFAASAHVSRSDRFTYLPTSVIVEAMIKQGFQPYSAKQGNSRIEGKIAFTKHLIRFRSISASGQLVVGDTIPEIVLINAHDGTSSYQLSAGYFRLKCLNGLMVSEGEHDSIRVHHKGDIVDQVIEASLQIVDGFERSKASIEEWNALSLTKREQEAFAVSAHELRFGDGQGAVDTPITPSQILQPRRPADDGDTLWQTMNRVQENVIRGGLTARAPRDERGRRRRLVRSRPIQAIDQDVRLNRALWKLSEEMAKLKREYKLAA